MGHHIWQRPLPPSGMTEKSEARVESREVPPLLPCTASRVDLNRPLSIKDEEQSTRVPWQRLAKRALLFLWISFLIFLLAILLIWGASPNGAWLKELFSPSAGCQPGGTFTPFAYGYSPWASSGLFEVAMGFGGALSFTEAKIIDTTWDLVSIAPMPFLNLTVTTELN